MKTDSRSRPMRLIKSRGGRPSTSRVSASWSPLTLLPRGPTVRRRQEASGGARHASRHRHAWRKCPGTSARPSASPWHRPWGAPKRKRNPRKKYSHEATSPDSVPRDGAFNCGVELHFLDSPWCPQAQRTGKQRLDIHAQFKAPHIR